MTDATTDRIVTSTTDPGDLRLELWVRSTCTWTYGRRDSLVQQVRDLAADGVVEEATVRMWDNRVPLNPADAGDAREKQASKRIETFQGWARNEGVEMPALDSGTVIGEGRLGPPVVVRTTPLAMLAAYDDDCLVWVAPHGTGEESVTVQDCIEALAAAAETTDLDSRADRSPVLADD